MFKGSTGSVGLVGLVGPRLSHHDVKCAAGKHCFCLESLPPKCCGCGIKIHSEKNNLN